MKKTKKTKETNIPVSKTNRTWAFLGGGEAKFWKGTMDRIKTSSWYFFLIKKIERGVNNDLFGGVFEPFRCVNFINISMFSEWKFTLDKKFQDFSQFELRLYSIIY